MRHITCVYVEQVSYLRPPYGDRREVAVHFHRADEQGKTTSAAYYRARTQSQILRAMRLGAKIAYKTIKELQP